MPELPEVEAMVRTLRPLVIGKRILHCEVLHPIVIARARGTSKRAAAREFTQRVNGMQIQQAERRGKFIMFHLDEGSLAMHFRLDGKVLWSDSGNFEGHVDVVIHLAIGALGYADPRHLGRVQWAPHAEDIPGIATLGPDPLACTFTPRLLRERLNSSSRTLKIALMDQARVAGIGNIYSSEALWRARLDPRRPASRLTAAECRRLHNSIVEVLKRALECCLAPAPDFCNPDWWFADLEKMLCVYGRKGKPCRRCGRKIHRFELGGRSTFACLRCQK